MASRSDGAESRIKIAASTLCDDTRSLTAEIRRSLNMIKEIAVDLERRNESKKVKSLENMVAELLDSYEDSMHHASAIESVANNYQLGTELTDFEKLLETEFLNIKSAVTRENHPLMRQFREAIWNVHHAGQPMPGEEQEDIVMTSTQCNILNITCPLSGKPVTELAEPVRSAECKHVYEKKDVMHHISSHRGQVKCPVAACPKSLRAQRVVCDPVLLVEIEEMRSMNRQNANVIEDFTDLNESDTEQL
ncbi:hypothetical protein K2173_011903 [Erythroxylum novogranatense]|uniref:SP-RING-type domain-containing protein n=1 Tax=Erythroxylum novogranatense TaxID=1862640 RepID=A0AAV8TES9_9ROSI|nr:hypothetical protein K2173_011903 [Erythroxylum novogranatense]